MRRDIRCFRAEVRRVPQGRPLIALAALLRIATVLRVVGVDHEAERTNPIRLDRADWPPAASAGYSSKISSMPSRWRTKIVPTVVARLAKGRAQVGAVVLDELLRRRRGPSGRCRARFWMLRIAAGLELLAQQVEAVRPAAAMGCFSSIWVCSTCSGGLLDERNGLGQVCCEAAVNRS